MIDGENFDLIKDRINRRVLWSRDQFCSLYGPDKGLFLFGVFGSESFKKAEIKQFIGFLKSGLSVPVIFRYLTITLSRIVSYFCRVEPVLQ